MNRNCFAFLNIPVLLLLLLGTPSLNRVHAQAGGGETMMEVIHFGYDTTGTRGCYRFYPLCGEDSIWCTGVQEQNHSYLWDFGDGRYSLEYMPVMCFDDAPTRVELRVTGLKVIQDPDARTGRVIITPTKNNCTPTDTFTMPMSLEEMEVDYPSLPTVRILQPSHAPVPGKCADYLIQFDLAESCKYSGEFELVGTVEGQTSPWVAIKNHEVSSGVHVQVGELSNSATIKLEGGRRTTRYLLLHCRFSEHAKPENLMHWKLSGKFVPIKATSECKTFRVDTTHTDRFQGSLDPSSFTSGASGWSNTGDTILWDLKILNEGNAPEYLIEVIDTLPREFALNVLHVSAQWAGKDIEAHPVLDSASREIRWKFHNHTSPLQPGEYATLQFRTIVTHRFDCADQKVGTLSCVDQQWRGWPIRHRIHTKFDGEQVEGLKPRIHTLEDNKTTVLCEQACRPTPNPARPPEPIRAWTPFWITIVIASGVIIYLLYLLVKARRQRRRIAA